MTAIDWLIVVALNGSIIAYALFIGSDTKTSNDWFLARRSLPWWIVGLSMYATAIDASDLVADNGGAYNFGISIFTMSWVGVIGGWLFMSQFIALRMYRAGMYTNAEYLEARFGPATRILSALIQVIYRTVVMGVIGTTVYLTLKIVAEWSTSVAWTAVVGIAFVATIYTVVGGLRSVAITDALQSLIMLTASSLLFVVVYNQVGGWSGVGAKLNAKEPGLAESVLRVGASRTDVKSVAGLPDDAIESIRKLGGAYDETSQTITTHTPAWLIGIYFTIVGMAYSIVNHTQVMRMLGSRSEWDLKMSVVVAGGVMLVVTFLNLSMGVMGRALYDLSGAAVDHVFPNIVRDYTATGLRGVVVAGIIAASFSTYDSIGSTLSALLTRDVYGRLLVRDRDEAHYLRVGRWLTPLIIFGSFGYVPFLQSGGMLLFFLDILGAFVVPLLTIYLIGALTRVHRHSALYGILVGVSYGILFLVSEPVAEHWGVAVLGPPFSNKYAVIPISMLLTAGTMVVYSFAFGWEETKQLRPLDQDGWLADSRGQIQESASETEPASLLPLVLGLLVTVTGIVLSFVVFW